ncbi:MAG: lipid-A-disaccharide synthase [Thermodesulfobacteriota bacterium]|nr:lipid-A-disaccharide synthase [Thermodesulfobacteriota bacterium]
MSEIMIIAGEASGDLHGAGLFRAMQQMAPEYHFCGMGGKSLKQQGVEIIVDAAKMAVVGIVEVLAHLKDIRAAMRTLEKRLRDKRPSLLILIDYPDFNLILAGKARKLGIPVFYYISPQVWAWRSGRIKKISRLVDRMAVILPFEKEFYHQHGMEVDYVGHPLMDSVKISIEKKNFLQRHDIPADKILVGILPGSRKKEIKTMLPIFLEAAKKLTDEHKEILFLLPLAPTLSRADLDENGLRDVKFDIRVISENRYDLMAACDLALAASGTVTLELAILDVPMLVAYRLSPLTYFLGHRFIKVKYASLTNLIVNSEIVPELLQDKAEADNIARELTSLLPGGKKRDRMLAGLSQVRARLGEGGASKRAAALALETISLSKKC